MPVDIDKLTEAELIDLNNRVVARLKFLPQMRAHAHMLDFSIGEKVSFQPEGHPPLTGIIAKYNRKAVTVIAERAAVERRARVPAQGRVVCAGEAGLRAGPQPARDVGGRPGAPRRGWRSSGGHRVATF